MHVCIHTHTHTHTHTRQNKTNAGDTRAEALSQTQIQRDTQEASILTTACERVLYTQVCRLRDPCQICARAAGRDTKTGIRDTQTCLDDTPQKAYTTWDTSVLSAHYACCEPTLQDISLA